MKMELMNGDNLEVSDDTPLYNPLELPFKHIMLDENIV